MAAPKIRDVAGICVLAYLLLTSYEISRASSESLFLEVYGKEALPWAWFAVMVAALLAVTVYNHFVRRVRLVPLFAASCVASAVLLVVIIALRDAGMKHATFALYVWKDVHVVVLLETVWTFANVVFKLRTARWVYGVFLVCGSAGGITGGLLVGELARRWGTNVTASVPVLLLLVLAAAALGLSRVMSVAAPARSERPALGEALRTLRKSTYLPWLLALIMVVQLVITLVDYHYMGVVQESFGDTNQRTRVMGLVNSSTNLAALALQALSGPTLRLAGIPLTLVLIPSVLGAALGGFLVVPRFTVMAVTKVASKAFDYSLFRAAKEMLYIPLSWAEKTHGKAMIDMLGYRVAKGGASVAILALAALEAGQLTLLLTLGLVVLWLLITVRVVRRFRRLVSREEEMS